MISSVLSHISALVLAVSGLALLFASDVVLPAIVPGFPSAAAWLGQMLGAAWLGVAALNWLQRNALLGGIYSRPTVFANGALYFITASSLLSALLGSSAPLVLWVPFLVSGMLAVVYGALLFRGPFDALQRSAG